MDSKPEFLDVEEVAEALGGIGRFQLLMYVFACLPTMFTATQTVAFSFTAYQPEFRCHIPSCDIGDEPLYDPNDPWIYATIPSSHGVLSQCTTYRYNVTVPAASSTEPCEAFRTGEEELSCSDWVFDLSEFKATAVTDFELICDDEHIQPLLTSLYMIGLLIGGPTWGIVSDKFGRKHCLILSTFCSALTGIVMALMPERISYCFMIVINGIANMGIFQTAFIIALEFVGIKHRTAMGIGVNFFYAFGEACLPLFAYLIDNWRLLQIVISAPMCLVISYYWIISESTRWLLSQGRWQDAKAVIERAASMNEVAIPEHLLPNENTTITSEKEIETISFGDVIKDMLVMRMIAVCAFGWFASSFAYYALSLNSSNLSGDIYLNFLFAMLAEFPGYTFLLLTLNRLGRRWTHVLCFLFSGLSCIVAGFIPTDLSWLSITLSLLGKMFISANYALVYIFTAEIFPTSIRTTTLGVCALLSRGGSIVSPFIANIGDKNEVVPFILCGSVALAAAILSLDLPETNGSNLPETLDDTKNLKRRSGGIFSLKTNVIQEDDECIETKTDVPL